MTSDGLMNPAAWVGAFVALMAFKNEGKDAEICARARDMLEHLDYRNQDYTNPLIASLETVASEGFWAAYRLEHFDDAFWFASIADEVAERIPGYSYGRARTLNNLALACMEHAELAKADALFRQALTLVNVKDDIRGLRDLILSNLSALSGMRGDAVVPSTQPILDPDPFLLQNTHAEWTIRNNRALEWLHDSRVNDAIAEYQALLRTPTLDTVTKATLLSNLGSAQLQAGDLAVAKRTLLKARNFCEETDYAGQVLAGILYELGEVESRIGEKDDALASLKAAWDAIRVVAPRSRMSLLILRSLGRTRFAQGDLRRARACFERGLAIYDEIRKDVATSEREHEGLFTIYRHISELLIWLSIDEERAFEVLQLMQQAKARYWSARLKRLRKQDRGDSVPAIDEERLRSVIGLNGVLIEFFVGANALFVFLAYNRWFQAYRVDVAEDELSSMVDELRRRLQVGLRGTEQAARLSHVLFGKARLDWKILRLLLIAPDGPLWRIPIDVLPAPISSGESQTIGALAPVTFIPSVSLIREMLQSQESIAPPVFVAVLYDGSSIGSSLTGAQQELDSIRTILSTRANHVILGGDSGVLATSANVAHHLPTGTYIHIAAHAFADEHGDEAYILLMKGNGHDERLTTSQIEALQLSARIVVLATCHSSSGRSSAGEGMVSLARSFLLAGARCVVASLWELNDLQSARFCAYLYTYLLEEASPAHAFRRAKDSYARAFGRDETWAGLTIIGDGDSWEDRFSLRYLELPKPINA